MENGSKVSPEKMQEMRSFREEICNTMRGFGLSPAAYQQYLLNIIAGKKHVLTDDIRELLRSGKWSKKSRRIIQVREKVLDGDLEKGRAEFEKVMSLLTRFLCEVDFWRINQLLPDE